MDKDIQKEKVYVSKDKNSFLLESTPLINETPMTVAETEPELSSLDIAARNIKKIREGTSDRNNLHPYPWEDTERSLSEANQASKKEEKYEKKTYRITAGRLREVRSKMKASVVYITTSPSGVPDTFDQYGNPYGFTPKGASNDIDDGSNHTIVLYGRERMGISKNTLKGKGWPFKYVPNTPGYGQTRAEDSVMSRPIPGCRNAYIPNRLLSPIKATLNPWSSEKRILYVEAADAFNKMYDAALKDGITIHVSSGYRDYAEQAATYKKWGKEVAAEPGKSNHGWGKAIDVWPAGTAMQESYIRCLLKNDFSTLKWHGRTITRFQYESAKKWINMNGDRFGFYWGDAWNEDWHFTYIY
jgi:hypothetical protein